MSGITYTPEAPATTVRPVAGKYRTFMSDGTSSTVANALYKIDSVGTLTLLQPAAYTDAQARVAVNVQGLNSSGTTPTIFRPQDYTSGNTYDPTGVSNSTSSFSAALAAMVAYGGRAVYEMPPGVFKVDPSILTGFANAPGAILGGSRSVTVLIPTAGTSDFIKLRQGADGFEIGNFAIYNTSGTPFTANAGISTNGCNDVVIHDMLYVDLFKDIDVGGTLTTVTTNGTTAISGISPTLVAGDVGKTVSGPGITPGTTIATQAGATGTLSAAASTSAAQTMRIATSIKVSIQRSIHFQTNGSASSVGILVDNGLAGDTYIGPDVVMSNGGGTRRRASVEIIESGHFEIIQSNLTGSQYGTIVDPGARQIVAFGFINKVLNDSCTIAGMLLNASTSTSTIKNIKSIEAWYSGTTAGAGTSGVVTQGVAGGIINGISFSNDRFLNNQQHGFSHTFGTDFRWGDCDMKGNSAQTSNTYDGLNVAAGVSNWSLNGGKYGGTDTAITGNQRYGIFVAAGAGDFIKISPDDLSGNSTGPLSNGATGNNVYVNGCPGLAPNAQRSTTTAAITTSEVVMLSITIPKNSVRVGTTIDFDAAGVISNTTTASTWTTRSRMGAATLGTPIVAQDTIASGVVARTNAPVTLNGKVTFYAVGAGGSALGHINLNAGSTTPGAGLTAAVAVDTTTDRLMEFTLIGVTGTPSVTIHNATIKVNY